MKQRKVPLDEALGMVIPHDLTKIVRGEHKGPAFRKGHVIKPEDIPELQKMGKAHIFVLELEHGEIHEDDAGLRIAQAAAGKNVLTGRPKESRVNLTSAIRGLLKVNVAALLALNELEDLVFSCLSNYKPVEAGELLAATKVVPLVVPEQTVLDAEILCQTMGKIIEVVPYQALKAGIVVTGGEVYHKRIKDTFGPVLREKLQSYGASVFPVAYAPDDAGVIAEQIDLLAGQGAELILVSGGMSVDPDDVTPQGIRLSGAKVEKYGAPVLPGAMFLLAYKEEIPIIGMPACGMYFRITVLDLILPRLFAGEKLRRADIIALAHGGLCWNCSECRYPRCSFGQGGILRG
ncbi:molybdopterin biosynthesis protein, putative [Heliomicrobium modesticaldum Ice1]|uniref:Molybdopterin molybdenumtransferase n=1 Tax=Heliobacterium modesticaldum (strain ATCC 51547 / Ice1) TaxID=498761 RepID=B0TBF6_HELMI|nr:molybdopterin-binding protein [Heliomicrobium modesticaldum]ABZ85169.1 molybdopterin biosynthesis protein, putative [Heliomicrobium modesticaldum Ice1]